MPKGSFDDTEKVKKVVARLLKLPRISIQTARNLELLKQQLEKEVEALQTQGTCGLKWPRVGEGNITTTKRPYYAPEVKKVERVEDLTAQQRQAVKEVMGEIADLAMIVDRDRRWVSVTESFARLLGYRTMDMIGKRVDDFTVEHSVDIQFVFKALMQIGEMDGIWMFRHRDGHNILVHYHSRLASGLSHAKLTPLLVA